MGKLLVSLSQRSAGEEEAGETNSNGGSDGCERKIQKKTIEAEEADNNNGDSDEQWRGVLGDKGSTRLRYERCV